MNLDNRSLSLLGIQMLLVSLVGAAVLFSRASAATRIWCIRLTILALFALVGFSQIPTAKVLPAARPIMLPPQMNAVSAVNHQLAKIGAPSVVAHTATQVVASEQPVPFTVSFVQIWMAGMILGFFWYAFALLRLRRTLKNSSGLRVHQGVEVRLLPGAGSPFVAGVLRPVIYLPQGLANSLSDEQMESVIAHERAHIENRDLAWKAVHRLACVALWPNLILWFLVSAHDRAMEEVADAEASLAAPSPERYAALLVSVAEQRAGRDDVFAMAMARKRSNIGRRVRQILSGRATRELSVLGRNGRLIIGLGALLCLWLAVAGFGWQATPKDPKKYPWQSTGGIVQFRILAPDGTPAINPQAWLARMQEGISIEARPLKVENGWVSVDVSDIPTLEWVEVVARDGEGNIGSEFAHAESPKTDLVMLPTCSVTGTFLRFDGTPESGVEVAANFCSTRRELQKGTVRYSSVALFDGPLAAKAKTDAHGTFTLRGIPQDSILQITVADPSVQQPFHAIKKGATTSYGFEIAKGPTTDLGRIDLKQAGQVSGRVLLNGKGVSGIHVGAQIVNDDTFILKGAAWGQGVTDQDGNYVIGGLGSARYNVALFMPKDLAEDYACEAKDSLAVEEGKVVMGEDLELKPGGIIEGEVILKGNPDPENYRVSYYGPDHPRSGAWCGGATCDKDGHFRIRVSAGKQFVYLGMSQPLKGQDVTVQDGQTVHVTLKE